MNNMFEMTSGTANPCQTNVNGNDKKRIARYARTVPSGIPNGCLKTTAFLLKRLNKNQIIKPIAKNHASMINQDVLYSFKLNFRFTRVPRVKKVKRFSRYLEEIHRNALDFLESLKILIRVWQLSCFF